MPEGVKIRKAKGYPLPEEAERADLIDAGADIDASFADHLQPRARYRLLPVARRARLARRHRTESAGFQCLICCPMPYSGCGWPQTCVGVVSGFQAAGLRPVLVTPRIRKALPPTVDAVQTLSFPLTHIPWKYVQHHARETLDTGFASLLKDADPRQTIAYFWPGSSRHLVEAARDRGIVTVREMINTYQGTAKRILDDAYARWGFVQTHPISQAAVEQEREELRLYDHVFAPSAKVEASLIEAGVDQGRIVPASYGWIPERFGGGGARTSDRQRTFRVLFAGMICIRKGVPELLRAWERSGVEGELVLVGDVEPALRPHLATASQTKRVRHIGYTEDIAAHYRDADVFIFPSLEEGCPQVTMEAGGCGLPVIATPMGAGPLVKHEVNGLIVPPGDIDALAEALRRMAADEELRLSFAKRIAADAQEFTYDRVSASRGALMADLLRRRANSTTRRAGRNSIAAGHRERS